MLKTKRTEIPIALIAVKLRYRTEVGDLEELKESITEVGLINPITVVQKSENTYELVAGQRRFEACLALGHTTIEATVYKDLTDIDRLCIELDENYQRVNFSYAEEVALKKKIFELAKAQNPKTSIRNMAKRMDTNRESLSVDLQLAEAIEFMPELANCSNKHEALKKFDSFQEELIRQVIHEKVKEEQDSGTASATVNIMDKLYKVGDALELLKQEKALSFSLIELDPPYGIEYDKLSQDSLKKTTFDGWTPEEFRKYMPIVINECYRILKMNGWLLLWFSMRFYTDIEKMLRDAGFMFDPSPIIWDKGNGRSNSPRTLLNQSVEPCLYIRKGQASLQKKGHPLVFKHKVEENSNHATPKPISLYSELLDCFAMEGQRALSPFAGSGNIILAAYPKGIICQGYDKFDENKKDFLIKSEKLL